MDLSLAFLLAPLMAGVPLEVLRMGPEELVALCRASLLQLDLIMLLCSAILAVLARTVYFMSRPLPVYLVDFACYRPPFTNWVPFSTFMEHVRLLPEFDAKSVEFQRRILERSGLGEETSFTPALHYIPPQVTTGASREEAKVVIFSATGQMLEKTGVKAKDVDILVVNCSLFSPTPSLSAMIVNKYKMRSNVRSFT